MNAAHLIRPIVQAPMAGATTPAMVAAASEAGALGSLPLGWLRPSDMERAVADVRARTSQPFACNLFVDTAPAFDVARTARAREALRVYRDELGLAQPEGPPASARIAFADQFEMLLALRPAVFSFTFGIPAPSVLSRARERGIATIGTANTVEEAIALEAAGVDAICAQGFEAGGHHGPFLSGIEDASIGTLALVADVVCAVRVPVIAAGGIGDGRGICAVFALGAVAAQLGSAFLLADESSISPAYRAVLAGPLARKTVLTTAFSGRAARGVRNAFSDAFANSPDVADYPDQHALTSEIRAAAAKAGRADLLSLWAGQAVALARSESTHAIVQRLMCEAYASFASTSALFRGFPSPEAYAQGSMEISESAHAHDTPTNAAANAPHFPDAEPVVAAEATPVAESSADADAPIAQASTAQASTAEAPTIEEAHPIVEAVPVAHAPVVEEAAPLAHMPAVEHAPQPETPEAGVPSPEALAASDVPSTDAPSASANSTIPRSLGVDPAVIERKRKAQEAWERAVAAHASGAVVEGLVTASVKGGLLVDVDGVRGFLPASQASPGAGIGIETLVKQKLPMKIIDVDAARKRVVVSHRRAAESQKRAARSTLLHSLAVGQRFEATVVRLADFGAFVDIGSGVDGLVPMSELAFERVEKVGDLLAVGDKFEASVIRIDEGGRKIALSRRAALPDPWRDHADVVRIGATIEGKVVGKEPRLQVEIAPGIVGAVRESDADPAEYEIGESIEVSIRNLDRRTRRITLTTLHGAAAAIVTSASKASGSGFASLGEELLNRAKKR